MVGADVGFVVPAAFAFLAVGAEDFDGGEALNILGGSGEGGMVLGFDLGNVEEFLQREEVIDDPGVDAVGETEFDLGVEGFADGFGLARFFEFGQDLLAEFEEVGPNFFLFRREREIGGGPIGFVDGFGGGWGARWDRRGVCPTRQGDEFPGFVGGVGDHGGEHLAETADDAMKRGLGGTAAG